MTNATNLKDSNSPKYPDVEVQLTGEDGNAFAVMGRVTSAMRKAKIDRGAIQAFQTEAMSGDYDNLLRVAMDTVSVS